MSTIIITSKDTITIDGAPYKVVKGHRITPGYPDFPPTLLEAIDKETGGRIVEFGINRLEVVDGEVTNVTSDGCDQFVVVPIE